MESLVCLRCVYINGTKSHDVVGGLPKNEPRHVSLMLVIGVSKKYHVMPNKKNDSQLSAQIPV